MADTTTTARSRWSTGTHRSFGWLFTAIAVTIALLAGLVFLWVMGRRSTSPLLVIGGALFVVAVVCWPLAALAGSVGWARKQNPVATLVMFAAIIACLAPGITAILVEPLPTDSKLLSQPSGFWELSTGSKIAYYKAGPSHASKAPVIVLHDGPGIAEARMDSQIADLAGQGHEVYAYDQIGAGMSARLVDPSEYTVKRMVDDLEAIRVTLDANQFYLIGTGWGAALAVQYGSMYPARVSAMILESPAPMVAMKAGHTDPSPHLSDLNAERYLTTLHQPRRYFSLALAKITPKIASVVVSDEQIDEWSSSLSEAALPAMACPGQDFRASVARGGGFSRLIMSNYVSDPTVPDPHPRLRNTSIPTLIIRGVCDYVPWKVAKDYRDNIPGAIVVSLSDQGHGFRLTANDIESELIRSFFMQQTLPLPVYREDADPSRR